MTFKFNLILFLLVLTTKIFGDDNLNKKRFPAGFMFGAATSAYQIEGGYNEDGKGESNWDRFVHSVPSPIHNNETGDEACDSYHKYKEDVKILKELGVRHYSFSISWTRILPTGDTNNKNQIGIKYYKYLIRELIDNDIEPFITLFHWDTPQRFEYFGSWTNEIIINKYVEYAKLCFELFGADVKYWLTFNDPTALCAGSYDQSFDGIWPGSKSSGFGPYLCSHNVLKAHAKIWHLYDSLYRPVQKGSVGIAVHGIWASPDSDSDSDTEAAERLMAFYMGWFLSPLLLGYYPPEMELYIGDRSIKEGFKSSRLLVFTGEEIEYIKGAYDFVGVNYNDEVVVKNVVDNDKTEMSFFADSETEITSKNVSYMGMGKMLNSINSTYGNNFTLIITANGLADDGTVEDDERVQYLQNSLSALRDALDEGINIAGYTVWSLMDSFEWGDGYAKKMGVYSVDFTKSDRPRTQKNSAKYLQQVYTTRCITDNSQCYD